MAEHAIGNRHAHLGCGRLHGSGDGKRLGWKRLHQRDLVQIVHMQDDVGSGIPDVDAVACRCTGIRVRVQLAHGLQMRCQVQAGVVGIADPVDGLPVRIGGLLEVGHVGDGACVSVVVDGLEQRRVSPAGGSPPSDPAFWKEYVVLLP